VARLGSEFFARDATVVAPELLNKLFVLGRCAGRIIEVEAYTNDDPAAHTFRGPTPRNAVMFGPAGRLYVYVSYGMHHCVNIVTGRVGDGQAVLLRALVPERGIDEMRARRGYPPDRRLCDGPGKLTQAFGIDRNHDGRIADMQDDGVAPPVEPLVGPRVGISRAVDWPRRFRVPSSELGSPAPNR
jgi:DNA-3-methyladenine glycosylase